jgi:hypothetical protein
VVAKTVRLGNFVMFFYADNLNFGILTVDNLYVYKRAYICTYIHTYIHTYIASQRRVARFLAVHDTKTGKNVLIEHKKVIKYSKCL